MNLYNDNCLSCYPEKGKAEYEVNQQLVDIYNAMARIERFKVWEHYTFSDLGHPLSWRKKAQAIKARHIMQTLATMGE